MSEKTFHILAPFTVSEKAMTASPHNGSTEGEVIKVAGYANWSGVVAEGDVYIDLVGDVVVPSGVDVGVWKKNPQILLQHMRDCTIGRGLKIERRKDGLYIEAEIHSGAMSPEDWYRVKAGLLCYFSIGFRTQKVEWKKVGDAEVCFITKSLLLEVSVVGIPANSESAFQIMKSLPLEEEEFGFYAGELSTKEVVPDNHTEEVVASAEREKKDQSMKIKVNIAKFLTPEQIEGFKALGLDAELDKEVEVDAPKYIEQEVTSQVAKATADFEARLADLTEKVAALTAKAETEEEATTETEEEEAKDAEVEEQKDAEEELTEEEAEVVKGLLSVVGQIKKALETE